MSEEQRYDKQLYLSTKKMQLSARITLTIIVRVTRVASAGKIRKRRAREREEREGIKGEAIYTVRVNHDLSFIYSLKLPDPLTYRAKFSFQSYTYLKDFEWKFLAECAPKKCQN